MASVILFFNSLTAQNAPNPDYNELDKQLEKVDIANYNCFKQLRLERFNPISRYKLTNQKILEIT
jgi:hypothetical protein